jgi:hypothetical protein
MSAKEQFLKDLQADKDFQNHKAKCIWKEVVYSNYHPKGFYAKDSGHYLVASVNNDTFIYSSSLKF